MKKTFAMILALAMTLSLGIQIALADAAYVNPQQRGHVAYLESEYGARKAKEILKGYGASSTVSDGAGSQQAFVPAQPYYPSWSATFVPEVSGSTSAYTNLRIGEYFSNNGQLYVVDRFTTIMNAPVLVAYKVTNGGYILDYTPRYFYL